VADRIDRFDAALAASTPPRPGAGPAWPLFDLPAELLHFTAPDSTGCGRDGYGPRRRTGALALVTTDDFDLGQGATRGRSTSASAGLAFVDETARRPGLPPRSNLFGADVFLASVYAVSMYTLLRMRMSREFNRVVPALPDLVRRLLGVYYCRSAACTEG